MAKGKNKTMKEKKKNSFFWAIVYKYQNFNTNLTFLFSLKLNGCVPTSSRLVSSLAKMDLTIKHYSS